MHESVLNQLPSILQVTKAARLVRKASTGNKKTHVESWGMGKLKKDAERSRENERRGAEGRYRWRSKSLPTEPKSHPAAWLVWDSEGWEGSFLLALRLGWRLLKHGCQTAHQKILQESCSILREIFLRSSSSHWETNSAERRGAVPRRGTSHQPCDSHRAFVSMLIWERQIWAGTSVLQVAEPLMKLLPAVMRKASELFPFIQAATIPQSQLQITLCLFWSLVLCRTLACTMENSVYRKACQQASSCFLVLQTLTQTLARFSALGVLGLLAQFSFG